ncbi:MAG: hypothetical protein Q7I93_06815 [Syntrophales bacterium]|nr:hypothetical protein [Syntrophales bacterium]
MNTQTGQVRQETSSWAGDLWGGLAAMLVALPSSIAFGVLTYTVIGPEYAGAGAMAGILGAAAHRPDGRTDIGPLCAGGCRPLCTDCRTA